MPLGPRFMGPLGLLFAVAGFFAGAWLWAPAGRAELETPAVLAPLEPPKLAPLPSPPVASAAASAQTSAPAKRAGVPAPVGPKKTWQTTLIVGLDRRPDGRGAGLADTLLVAVFDEASGQAGIVSVPRDLWVTIPGHGDDRINVIPTVAKRTKQDMLELFGRVLDDTLGLPVNHVIVVDLGVFERTVELVGGVEVDVPCPIVDSFVDDRVPGGRRKLDLAAGPATLDGPTAAMYVRSRHGRSDFGRSRRQQAVLLGIRDRLFESDGFSLVPALFDEVEKSVVTNLTRIELFDVARRALELDRARLHGLVLAPPLTTSHRTEDGKAVLLPERPAIDDAIARLFDAALPGEPPAAVCPPADAALKGR